MTQTKIFGFFCIIVSEYKISRLNFLQVNHEDIDSIFRSHHVAKGKFGLKFAEYKDWLNLHNPYQDSHGLYDQGLGYSHNAAQIPMESSTPCLTYIPQGSNAASATSSRLISNNRTPGAEPPANNPNPTPGNQGDTSVEEPPEKRRRLAEDGSSSNVSRDAILQRQNSGTSSRDGIDDEEEEVLDEDTLPSEELYQYRDFYNPGKNFLIL